MTTTEPIYVYIYIINTTVSCMLYAKRHGGVVPTGINQSKRLHYYPTARRNCNHCSFFFVGAIETTLSPNTWMVIPSTVSLFPLAHRTNRTNGIDNVNIVINGIVNISITFGQRARGGRDTVQESKQTPDPKRKWTGRPTRPFFLRERPRRRAATTTILLLASNESIPQQTPLRSNPEQCLYGTYHR